MESPKPLNSLDESASWYWASRFIHKILLLIHRDSLHVGIRVTSQSSELLPLFCHSHPETVRRMPQVPPPRRAAGSTEQDGMGRHRRAGAGWGNGRSERIRTSGPCLPKTVLYQAELHSGRAAL